MQTQLMDQYAQERENNDKENIRIVVVALLGDLAVAIAKMIGAVLTGSAVMFAEGMHSLADMVNHGFLFLGFKLSDRPADSSHPFGYGKESYFWSFIVSVSIFLIGSILSIQRGIDRLMHPAPLHNLLLSYFILAISMAIEFYSWQMAYKSLVKNSEETTIMGMIREATTPSTMIVFLADSAAIVGLIFAAIGLGLSHVFVTSFFDAITSIIIGILLACVAMIISWETKSLLIGEGVTQKDYRRIRNAVITTPGVERILDILTMYLGPNDLLVAININFSDSFHTDDIENAIDLIERKVKEAVPESSKIFIEAKSVESADKQ